MTTTSYHYYAFDAAQLLETCTIQLQDVVELDTRGSHAILYELKEGLLRTENMLQTYFIQVIREDNAGIALETPGQESSEQKSKPVAKKPLSLTECMSFLRTSMEQQRENSKNGDDTNKASTPRHDRFTKSPARQIQTLAVSGTTIHDYSSSRNVTDTLLFRLIVALQLCQVRIDDAHFVIAGCRRHSNEADAERTRQKRRRRKWMANIGYYGGILGVTAFLLRRRDSGNSRVDVNRDSNKEVIQVLTKVGSAAFIGRMTMRKWKTLWMTSKLDKTMVEIVEWQQQWTLVHSCSDGSTRMNSSNALSQLQSSERCTKEERLIDYAQKRNPGNNVCSCQHC